MKLMSLLIGILTDAIVQLLVVIISVVLRLLYHHLGLLLLFAALFTHFGAC